MIIHSGDDIAHFSMYICICQICPDIWFVQLISLSITYLKRIPNVLSSSISKKLVLNNHNGTQSINLTASFAGHILLYVRPLYDMSFCPNTKQSEVQKYI